MKRLLSALTALAIVAGSTAAVITPSSAATMAPAAFSTGSGSIVPVVNGHRVEGDGRPQGYYPNERRGGWSGNRHHRGWGNYPYSFFPFAFAPRHDRRDCFRNWDGTVSCRYR